MFSAVSHKTCFVIILTVVGSNTSETFTGVDTKAHESFIALGRIIVKCIQDKHTIIKTLMFIHVEEMCVACGFCLDNHILPLNKICFEIIVLSG